MSKCLEFIIIIIIILAAFHQMEKFHSFGIHNEFLKMFGCKEFTKLGCTILKKKTEVNLFI